MDVISALTIGIAAILRERFLDTRWTIEHVPTPLSLKEFERVLKATPWIGISWRETQPGAAAGRSTPATLAALVTIVVKNNGIAARLLGDAAGPGLYPSLELARMSLHGRSVADIGTLTVARWGQAYSDGYGNLAVAIGVIELETVTRIMQAIAEGEEPPDFATLATEWDFAPGEGSPADTVTDIIDTGDET